MADSTLAAIRKKVRRLTRSPVEAQISTADIDEYVNTFVLYDFPEHLRLFSLRTDFHFYTEPYLDTYDSDNVADELYDFKNKYITVHEPIYIDGKIAHLYQDRTEFYGQYPKVLSRIVVGIGDGANMAFAGTLQNVPILAGEVLFSTVSLINTTKELHDVPNPPIPTALLAGNGNGNIDYVTGDYDLLFDAPPADGADIVAHVYPYKTSVPQSLLFFDNKFVVRPIPDQAYKISMEVYKRPTELLANNQSPELEQWWQYVSYGASLKILQDRLDVETIALIMPEFKTQERLILRKTLVQQSNSRVPTIYTDGLDVRGKYGWWNTR